MCATFDVVARGDYLYLIILTIDYLWYRYMYEIHISEAFKVFKKFRYGVKKQTKKIVKVF